VESVACVHAIAFSLSSFEESGVLLASVIGRRFDQA
jgi:hypothetical protein